MQLQFRRTFLAFLTISGLGLAAYAYSNPGVAACVVSDGQQVPSTMQAQLLSDSKARIQQSFGSLQSKPMVVFFNEPNTFWPLKPNEYGSTNFIGSRVCVIVGPKGQNIDVLAHELMHAEIAARVGYWRRFTQLPVWFDEGLAMQVDYRPNYTLSLSESESTKVDYVKSLQSSREFFAPSDELLTKNYASAKVVVNKWVTDLGNSAVFSRLELIRAGESFESMINHK
jgi:putative transposon-encoded protein